MTKTEFLLTISTQNQEDKWWEPRKVLIGGLLADPKQNSQKQHQKNCIADSKEKH